MKTKDVIKKLKELDPKGNADVLIGDRLTDIDEISYEPVVDESGSHKYVTIT